MDDLIQLLKKTIPDLVETGTKEVSNSGVYLYFDKLQAVSYNKDILSFDILLASHYLSGKSDSITHLANKIRKDLKVVSNSMQSQDIFKSMEMLTFNDPLYICAIKTEIVCYQEVANEVIL